MLGPSVKIFLHSFFEGINDLSHYEEILSCLWRQPARPGSYLPPYLGTLVQIILSLRLCCTESKSGVDRFAYEIDWKKMEEKIRIDESIQTLFLQRIIVIGKLANDVRPETLFPIREPARIQRCRCSLHFTISLERPFTNVPIQCSDIWYHLKRHHSVPQIWIRDILLHYKIRLTKTYLRLYSLRAHYRCKRTFKDIVHHEKNGGYLLARFAITLTREHCSVLQPLGGTIFYGSWIAYLIDNAIEPLTHVPSPTEKIQLQVLLNVLKTVRDFMMRSRQILQEKIQLADTAETKRRGSTDPYPRRSKRLKAETPDKK